MKKSSTMFHQRLWNHQHVMLENYYQYGMHDFNHFTSSGEQPDEDTEHTGDEMQDMMTSETSGDQSPNPDLFRLAFAASQWSKLVLNAEGLFNKLMSQNVLPVNEQGQIEQWLCMKQEYEECIVGDDSGSLQGYAENSRRSLERIEEVTETDEKSDESNHWKMREKSGSLTESDVYDDDEQSDTDSENPDFLDKLDMYMKKFRSETDSIIDLPKKDVSNINKRESSVMHLVNNNNFVPIAKPTPVRNPGSRRISILPYSEMGNEVKKFTNNLEQVECSNIENSIHDLQESPTLMNSNDKDAQLSTETFDTTRDNNGVELTVDVMKPEMDPEHRKMLKSLILNTEAKQFEVKKIQSGLGHLQKQMEDLQNTIKMKEHIIIDVIRNCDARARENAKQKFQRKQSKLEEEYFNARTQLAQATNALLDKNDDERSLDCKEIEVYKNQAIHYKKRLKDIGKIKKIADNSVNMESELQASLNSSKKEMEKLKKQLKREVYRKLKLDEELAADQKKLREIDEKYHLTSLKVKEVLSDSDEDQNSLRSKSECMDKKKDLVDVSARISRLDYLLKEMEKKSMDLERTADTDSKERQARVLRQEIDNLRTTKDRLIEESRRFNLDEKYQYEQSLNPKGERELLFIRENIEAIDVMIEQKNELICGKSHLNDNQSQREKGEQMLFDLGNDLAKLSVGELRTLFVKYFCKVIDLNHTSKILEKQNRALEAQQTDAERKMILIKTEYEKQIHLMLRYYAEETSSSGYDKIDGHSELEKYKKENRDLRRRLADVEALLKGSAVTHTHSRSPVRSPKQGLKQIAMSMKPTTKVTRQRNKLIIQKTTDCEKKK